MKHRVLGKTNLRVSVVGLGTWQFGGEWGKTFSQTEVDAIIGTAADHGINLIDTAECYGDHLSEKLVGKAVGKSRDNWIIATKFGHSFHGLMNRTRHWDVSAVSKQLDASLKALGTDYVDILQFHSPTDEEFANEELWEFLSQAKSSGKIRHIGNSISKNDNVSQTDLSDRAGVETIQVVYNRLSRKPEQGVFDSCIRRNLGVLARVPLAGGFLSGKYDTGATFPKNDHRSKRSREQIDETVAQVKEIRENEIPVGFDTATWSLAWCLQHPAVSCIIPGCKSVEQVRANATAADLIMVSEKHPLARG